MVLSVSGKCFLKVQSPQEVGMLLWSKCLFVISAFLDGGLEVGADSSTPCLNSKYECDGQLICTMKTLDLMQMCLFLFASSILWGNPMNEKKKACRNQYEQRARFYSNPDLRNHEECR
jgi:hypothetical protein